MFNEGKIEREVPIKAEEKIPEKKSGRVVVEIGPGIAPTTFLHEDVPEVEIGKDDRYFAVELDKFKTKSLKRSVDQIGEQHGPDFKSIVMRADGKQLPFQDESVDEIILPNVLNADLSNGEVHKIFDEALRVAKKGGKIIIFETYGAANNEYDNFLIDIKKWPSIKVEEKRGPKFENMYEVTKG